MDPAFRRPRGGLARWLLAGAFAVSTGSAAVGQSLSLVTEDVPEFLRQWEQQDLPALRASLSDTAANRSAIVASLEELNDSIQTETQINEFRRWSGDDEIVAAIIPLAAGTDREMRIPAALVLANVVDNTNVCHVLAYLRTQFELDVNGRYNLLQVVLQVANYAFDDTASWMRDTVSRLRAGLGKRDTEATWLILSRIEMRIDERASGRGQTLENYNPSKHARCIELLGTKG